MKKMNKVVAIRYDIDEEAPKVLAKGRGIIADKLLEKGKLEDIPIYKDEKLADELTKLDIGTYIPPELYEVVAEVLTFLDHLDQKFKE